MSTSNFGCTSFALGEIQKTLHKLDSKITDLDSKFTSFERGRFTRLESNTRAFRRDTGQKLDKLTQRTEQKLDIVHRRLGSVHETLCRTSLKNNMPFLARECKVLEAFSAKAARIPCRFTNIRKIADYLQLRSKEITKLEDFMKVKLKGMGVPLLRRFLTIVQTHLVKVYAKHQKVWPSYAVTCNELTLKVEELLEKEPMPVVDIVHTITLLKELGADHGLQVVCDLAEDVNTIFYLCCGPKKNVKEFMILDNSWGLMLLFWAAFDVLRHGELELDVKGGAERRSATWQIAFGEIKSSEGIAVKKGKRQLKFAADVFRYICEVVWPNCVVEVAQVLFVVNHEQHEPCESAIKTDTDVVVVCINQLPD